MSVTAFTPDQEDFLRSNLLRSIETGLATRYSSSHAEYINRTRNLAWLTASISQEQSKDHISAQLERTIDDATSSVRAELPFAFRFVSGNMSQAITVAKVQLETGGLLPGSDVQIGLIGGLANDGSPTHPFTIGDVEFAMMAVEAQRAVGLQFE